MNIYITNVSRNIDVKHLEDQIAKHLHAPRFQDIYPTRMNFHVFLHSDRRNPHRHIGTGILTLPDQPTAELFLDLHGSPLPQIPLVVDRRRLSFEKSRRERISKDIQEKIKQPYQDRRIAEIRQQRLDTLAQAEVTINELQFGWECRDNVFSIECEKVFHQVPAVMCFQEERRELHIRFWHETVIYVIAMNYSHIRDINIHRYHEEDPVVVFSLSLCPTFLCTDTLKTKTPPHYDRLSFLPVIPGHQRVAPYASLAIRVVCTSLAGMHEFRQLCNIAQLRKISTMHYPVAYRKIFSARALDKLDEYMRKLPWLISFQILALLHNTVLNVKDVLTLMPLIADLYVTRGANFVVALLRKFLSQVNELCYKDASDKGAVLQSFLDTAADMSEDSVLTTLKPTEGSLCDTYHVIITPTSMLFEGPRPERSNRVIRAYNAEYHHCFLRVSFLDEGKLQYRFNHDVSGTRFIRSRVGPYLLDGLHIAGRTFGFLAYSQSALKEHSVWFVKPFKDRDNTIVDARSIIKSLGTFDKLDKKLVYCPARYAARISQAFTATDAVEVEVEEIIYTKDIETPDKKYQFTDGVGTMSTELSEEINDQLKKNSRRRGRLVRSSKPSSYQIRFQGVKGMVSIDYKLRGMTMCVRPSMIKFEAEGWNHIEIARAFDRPTAYYLNRPLIMLLEGLGVPYHVFEKYQRRAVLETQRAKKTLGNAANGLFDRYGLGPAFRISSVLLNLQKLGFDCIPNCEFYKKMLEGAVHHVLRDFKNHARIPIPGAWTLVGVADVHRYLAPNEIFACIKPVKGGRIYLEGPVLVSRSPTIHPGDATIVHAIGRPQPGTCFDFEPLTNTVVFSVQGDRPIPSRLGGGDLDGDVYNLIPLKNLPEFKPTHTYMPADYAPSERKTLDHPSTMDDVAEFVMEYINSDVVGIIATNWLLIADRSDENIFDQSCLELAYLHSDAVDYPKSGRPVELDRIPRPDWRMKPDWQAPETLDFMTGEFYQSTRAIGRLFRDIDLPIEPIQETRLKTEKEAGQQRKTAIDDIQISMRKFNTEDHGNDKVFAAVEERVQEFIDTRSAREADERMMLLLFDSFASTLKSHCIANTLTHTKSGQLSEAEAVVGTITQRTSQRRKRKDAMAKLREDTDILVRGIREKLAGNEDISHERYLERSWVAWELALIKKESKDFGADAFWWVALGAIFDAIREIEETME